MLQTTYSMEDGKFVRRETQNVDNILEANLQDRNSGENDRSGQNMRKIASIPLATVTYLKTRSWKEGGPIDLDLIGCDHEHAARFTLWLNSRDNLGFRTSNARV